VIFTIVIVIDYSRKNNLHHAHNSSDDRIATQMPPQQEYLRGGNG